MVLVLVLTLATEFEQEEDPASRSFFSEIISSISDVRFSHDGKYMLSRDYLTVKIWDVAMERQPVKVIPIHEHLRPRLCDTYENDSIFDKFEVVFSGDAKNVMTGSYNNNFMIYPTDEEEQTEVVLQADKSAFKAKKVGVPTPMSQNGANGKKNGSRAASPAAGRMKRETDAVCFIQSFATLNVSLIQFPGSNRYVLETRRPRPRRAFQPSSTPYQHDFLTNLLLDFNKKILHMSWHPHESRSVFTFS